MEIRSAINPADKQLNKHTKQPTNKQLDRGGNITSLRKVRQSPITEIKEPNINLNP